MTEREEDDWIETVTRWAATLGFNPVRVRWKLRRLSGRLESFTAHDSRGSERPRYRHRICIECGALQDRDSKVCSRCGAQMGPRFLEVARRAGFELPKVSVSLLLGLIFALAYMRLMIVSPEGPFQALFSMERTVLFVHGWFIPDYFFHGQWWRIFTAQFLHNGMWHLAFNLFALSIVGPHVEDMYGRQRTLFLFLSTGALANLVSSFFNPLGNVGASGALMGLIGIAAGRGHRQGTTHGRFVRNQMLKWLAYTFIFGLFIGADNAAHVGGFVVGGLIGFLMDPRWLRRPVGKAVGWIAGLLGSVGTLVTAYLVFIPPVSLL